MDLPQIQAIGLQICARIPLAFASRDSCPDHGCTAWPSRKLPTASLLTRCPIAPRSTHRDTPKHYLKRVIRDRERGQRSHSLPGQSKRNPNDGPRTRESRSWRRMGRTVEPEHFRSKFAAFRSCALFGSRLLMSDAKGHQKTLDAGTPKLL
jgi:hypothetical protein